MKDNQELTSKELEPCSFCPDGGLPHIQTAFSDSVICAKCGCAGWKKNWNTRAPSEQLTATQQKLDVAVEALRKAEKILINFEDDISDHEPDNKREWREAKTAVEAALNTIGGK